MNEETEEVTMTPEQATATIEESVLFFQTMHNVIPGSTSEEKSEKLLTFCVLFLAGFVNSVPEEMRAEATHDVFVAIEKMAEDMRANQATPAE